jgi:hypothetical protein
LMNGDWPVSKQPTQNNTELWKLGRATQEFAITV